MNDGFIYGDQIFVIIGLFLLSFWMIRWYLWGIKTYPLNNSAQKKRKKGETIREWREILNTDSMHYHGSNAGNGGTVHSDEIASHGRQHSLSLTLPPLATIWLVREAE